MAAFVVVHGAWSAGWAWKKLRPLMTAAGHQLYTPTLTGLGERAHLAHAGIDLETHIADVVGVLTYEDLHDIILIGHSYGGIVATGVADRARGRIAHLVYLDAFVPEDGESLFDLVGSEGRERMRDLAASADEGWLVPPNPMPPDTPDSDKQWAEPLRRWQPIKTLEQPLRSEGGALTLPRSYIWCTRSDTFTAFAGKAKAAGWHYYELDASHNPHITCPEELAMILDGIAAQTPC